MDVFLYFPPDSGVALSAVEDVIDEKLGDRGGTTGGGLGDRGGNVDIELYDDADWERILGGLVGPLVEEGLSLDAYFTLPDLPGAPRRTLMSLLPSRPDGTEDPTVR